MSYARRHSTNVCPGNRVRYTFWLLQSRPITNLPSPPLRDVSWDPPVEGMKLVRRQVVEHMPDPLSPLFAELYLQDHLDKSIVNLMDEMESPFDIDLFIERPLFATVNGYAYLRADYRLSWRLIWLVPQILYWYVGFLRRFLPTVIPRWRDERMPAYLATVERWKGCDIPSMSEQELLSGVRALSLADAIYWFDVSVVVGAAKVTDGLLNIFLTSRAVGGDLTSGMFFYLESRELVDASTERAEGRAYPELAQHAERRRELREARKKLHPPVMVPVKSRFKFGPGLRCLPRRQDW